MIVDRLDNLFTIKNSPDLWLDYPIATMPESEKIVATITDISRNDKGHQASLYRKAAYMP